MCLGIAEDHGGYELKVQLLMELKGAGHTVVDFGAYELVSGDDYADSVMPLARAVAAGEVGRGVAICGSGVEACVAANKVANRMTREHSMKPIITKHALPDA